MSQHSDLKVSVRPVVWNKLLDAIDLLYEKKQVPLNAFEKDMGISYDQSQEVARVLLNMKLIKKEKSVITINEDLENFVGFWTSGNIHGISQLLQKNYLAYRVFLKFIKEKGPLPIINKKDLKFDKENPKVIETISQLNCIGFNLGSFDILTRLAAPLGAIHVSNDYVYFAENEPTQIDFDKIFLKTYNELKIGSEEYAIMGDVADMVCTKLGISLKSFDNYFKNFYDQHYKLLRTSSSVMIKPNSPREIITLQKRSKLPRFDRRHLVDGVNVYDINIKTFRMLHND